MASGPLGFFFGSKPKVPTLQKVDPNAVQQQGISADLSQLPDAEKLSSQVNQFSLDELLKASQFAVPGGLAKAGENINAQLSGQLSPEDTQATIRNATAAGYGRGFSFGSGSIGRNLVLRDLGLSTLSQQQQGLTNFMNLSSAFRPQQLSPTSMFLTPQQRLSSAMQANEDAFNRDWLEAQISAAPNPAGAFTAQLTADVIKAIAKGAGSAIAG